MSGMASFTFSAMASPCEVRVATADEAQAQTLGKIAEAEARRIEAKYSRYLNDSITTRINTSDGEPIEVDEETAALLDYADSCYRLSDGLFDVTSGVLRQIWRFDGSDNLPSRAAVKALLQHIGWSRVDWEKPVLRLPAGMEIDFGGLGKEYAVDSAVLKIRNVSQLPVLVNFGGDLRVTGPLTDQTPWMVAIESADGEGIASAVQITGGALTTSGDARRFLVRDGIRYSHILDPRSGWPVMCAPRSVTVAAPTCMEAGVLSTLAMLHGERAEAFLSREGIQSWVIR